MEGLVKRHRLEVAKDTPDGYKREAYNRLQREAAISLFERLEGSKSPAIVEIWEDREESISEWGEERDVVMISVKIISVEHERILMTETGETELAVMRYGAKECIRELWRIAVQSAKKLVQ